MRQLFLILLAAAVSIPVGTAPATAAQPESIAGSYAAWDNGAQGEDCWSAGSHTLCFYYHNQSDTWSYPMQFRAAFPAGWTVTDGWLADGWSCVGCGSPGTLMFHVYGQEAVYDQVWQLAYGHDACDAYYCAQVTIPEGLASDPQQMPWFIDSDGYGGGPEDTCDTSGYYPCDEHLQPPAQVPGCLPTMHVRNIGGYLSQDGYGRWVLKADVAVVDEGGLALGNVAVTASIWAPDGGPHQRTRATRSNGRASFQWKTFASGSWQLCVDNLVKNGYAYDPGQNHVTCQQWQN